MPHVLVVGNGIQPWDLLFAEHGHAASATPAGLAALEAAVADRPDVILVDLPGSATDGPELVRMIRSVTPAPMIVAMPGDDVAAIVAALGAGADDYLITPATAAEADTRIRGVVRRSSGVPVAEPPLTVGELRIAPHARRATLGGAVLDLTPREFDLLHYLARRAGRVVTRRELLTEVWRQPEDAAGKTIDVHVSWLRRKLGETARHPRLLHTVPGVGIRLVATPDPAAR